MPRHVAPLRLALTRGYTRPRPLSGVFGSHPLNAKTVLGTGPVSGPFVRFSLGRNGFSIDRIRADRILHEALTAGPDPLHLTLVFNIEHSTALRYATIAEHLLNNELETTAATETGQNR